MEIVGLWSPVRFAHVVGATPWVGGQLTLSLVILPLARHLLAPEAVDARVSRMPAAAERTTRYRHQPVPTAVDGDRVLAYGPQVATWDDVRQLALGLPETSEQLSRDTTQWRVKDKFFVWERPLRSADFEALGDTAPDGPILGVRVVDVGVKEALLASDPDIYFTTPHFEGYPAVLVRLDRIDAAELGELIVEAWLVRAPKRLAKEYLEASGS